ncbi:MAG: serine/threonine protein kinase [Acidobacteriota bacterium]|nr:serine/threonine protein kinase [Acidobacteriota bacterium]
MNRAFDTNQSIGEYRIVDFIGAGGMGEVYRAMHSKIGRVAAVKVLTQTGQTSDFVERFFNEARIQASLQHPNIATLYDFCEVAGQPCIIMEYVDGQTISERVAAYRAASGAPPPLSETVYIFGRVVEAIEYVHRHGIIHRDIKSNNIKVSSAGQVKLLDFGIAKGQTSPGLTQVGAVIGTLQYLAPELIRGGVADERGDIWALGVLLYEMVTGRMPFEAQTVGDLSDKIGRAAYAPPAQYVSGLPRPFADVIAHCLRRNPAERPGASELLRSVRQLEAVVSTPGLSTDVSEAVTDYVEAKSGGSSKSLPLLVGASAAFAVLLILGGVAFFAFGGGGASADTANANAGANLKKGLNPTPASSAAREDDCEVNVFGLRADVYRGGEKVGRTPYTFKCRLGEHVQMTLKSDGYADGASDFTVSELKKRDMVVMKKSEPSKP